jgi:drug/metabolite transporter (DMT)-like permease
MGSDLSNTLPCEREQRRYPATCVNLRLFASLKRILPYLLVSLAPLFWSGNFVMGRALHDQITPIALSFWRWTVALLVVLPFVLHRLRELAAAIRGHWAVLSLLGVLGVTNFNTFVYIGLQTTTATNAVLLVSTTPVLILALSLFFFGIKVGPLQGFGVLLSLAGVGAIVTAGDLGALSSLQLNAGDLWIMAAVLSWALYSVGLRWRPEGLVPLVFLTATMVTGLVPLLPLYLWDLKRGTALALDGAVIGAVAYVAIFPSVLAYVFWNKGVAELGANHTGQFLHLMPVFGTLLSMLLLGERLAGFHLAGIALIASGILLAGGRQRANDA